MKRVKISVWGNNASYWKEEQLPRAYQADKKNMIDPPISNIFQTLKLRSDRRRRKYLSLEDKLILWHERWLGIQQLAEIM
jgi:hypothetical protein